MFERSGIRESRMSSKGSVHVELEPFEVKKLRIELQPMTEESPGVFVGRHEQHTGPGQEGQRPVVVRQRRGQHCCRGEPRRGRIHCYKAESRRCWAYCCTRDDFRDGDLRNFGETGHGEAAVPVEVGPERG